MVFIVDNLPLRLDNRCIVRMLPASAMFGRLSAASTATNCESYANGCLLLLAFHVFLVFTSFLCFLVSSRVGFVVWVGSSLVCVLH